MVTVTGMGIRTEIGQEQGRTGGEYGLSQEEQGMGALLRLSCRNRVGLGLAWGWAGMRSFLVYVLAFPHRRCVHIETTCFVYTISPKDSGILFSSHSYISSCLSL